MRSRAPRFGILASTGGAVMGKLVESPWFRSQLALVAVDRPCGALERASAAGLPVALCTSDDAAAREVLLSDAFERHGVEHVFVFYTRMLRHDLLRRYAGRLWNLHPSLLPAFPGAHGFEDSFAARVPVLQAPPSEQRPCVSCFGGHCTEPYEQNTQQSPGLGRRTVWHCTHS